MNDTTNAFKVIDLEGVKVNQVFYVVEAFDKYKETALDEFIITSTLNSYEVDIENAQKWAWEKANDFIARKNLFSNKDIFADRSNLKIIVTPNRKVE